MKSNDLRKDEIVEWYVNGRLWKSCPYKKLDQTDNKIKDFLKKKKYEEVWNDSFLNRVNGDVYINIEKQKCIVLADKVKTSFCDKYGYPIYEHDTIEKDGISQEVWMDPSHEYFYVTYPVYRTETWGFTWNTGSKIIKITDFSEWTKVKDALDIPKRLWRRPLTTEL